jgi:hypothetical protein
MGDPRELIGRLSGWISRWISGWISGWIYRRIAAALMADG